MSNLIFGPGLRSKNWIMGFNYLQNRGVFHVVVESGTSVKAIELTPEILVDSGAINLEALYKLLSKMGGICK